MHIKLILKNHIRAHLELSNESFDDLAKKNQCVGIVAF